MPGTSRDAPVPGILGDPMAIHAQDYKSKPALGDMYEMAGPVYCSVDVHMEFTAPRCFIWRKVRENSESIRDVRRVLLEIGTCWVYGRGSRAPAPLAAHIP